MKLRDWKSIVLYLWSSGILPLALLSLFMFLLAVLPIPSGVKFVLAVLSITLVFVWLSVKDV